MSFAASGVDVALRDGGSVHVRPVRPEDAAGLHALLSGLSDEARYFRFFTAGVNLRTAAGAMAEPAGGLGLVAKTGPGEEIVGHALYVRGDDGDDEAEVACAVAGAWEQHGLATTLL